MHRADHSRLTEGMRAGDLEDMVLPLVSLDEYQSKISEGDDAVVLGLYVQDMQAADDLNRFLQKSAIDILDTERSPAPDQTGYFFVFVELPNNARLGDNIASILDEIGPLVGVDTWQVKLRGVSRIIPLDSAKIGQFFARRRQRRAKAAEQKEPTQESLRLPPSPLRDTQGRAIERALNVMGEYHIMDRGAMPEVLARNGLDSAAISFAPRDLTECRRMADRLGGDIAVTRIGDCFILHDGDNTVLLRRD